MEAFGDDELGLVLKRVIDRNDRKSCAQVCNQWLRVEGLTRLALRILEPELLRKFLLRFPNLITLEAAGEITNSDLELIAETCPDLRLLNLNLRQTQRVLDEFEELGPNDVGDDGVCAVAIRCPALTKVFLRRRSRIGNVGVVDLIKSSQNLSTLDLAKCTKITDQALEAIEAATSLRVLNLRRIKLPKAFAAKGTPSHFFTISLPITSKFAISSLPSPNAHCLNRSQQSSSESPFKWRAGKVPMIDATFSTRVVTRIEHP
ncbi:uncharacterized protein LOC122071056 [Macadamia integrifolia]|uniref:uncharacterized protein LOC122071056 n=1 Tax=Macadamia integrifolia TaxID=60698 RepID=UPI001C4E4554|nr:uncharacterized protein LOC122071056 [Macadamia integrifolia]